MVEGAMSGTDASRLTAANAVTSIRLLAAPALGAAVLCGASALAGALFALAVASDFADGAVARRRGESSPFGGLLDHASDALFCTCGLAALAATNVLTPLLPLLVALAFAQYALDSKVVDGGALRASALGRWNGIAYYVMLGIPVVRDALRLGWPGPGLVRLLAVALTISTAISMADRAWAWRHRS
jgi:CDP-diacylglycerol--glycerol-3-phosphate 3-phosphatidyltransferase